ncbi:MAG TPA: caspase family protein [Burkholderiales bacterium]|nr:caspase family protein [Burkholderiales bacterium]
MSKRLIAIACALMATSALAETHALIMTISNYAVPGVSPLKGVAEDAGSAKEIARRLGVREANMIFLSDGQLTHAGMDAAFDRLHERIAPNDNVFIYYSGHGGRALVRDPDERCGEALITVEGRGFMDTDIEAKLRTLSRRANKMVVFLDACHSGGATTRATSSPGAASSRFQAKYFPRSTPGEACSTPVNVLKKNIGVGTRSAGSGALNYTYIAAARDNEVSLDEPGRGGVATQAWLECVRGRARDLDGSGAITADEIQSCAQDLINAKLRNVPGYAAHHISITGNSRAVLGFVERQELPPPAGVSPVDTLKDIYAQRDDRRVVTVSMREQTVRIGRDKVEFTVSSSHPGYLYLLMVGSDGKTFDMLFPNQLDRSNRLEAGEALRLPRANWEVVAGGPPGTTQLLAMVADAPRDFSKLALKPAGPFSIVEASSGATRDVQLATIQAPGAAADECADAKRNLALAQRCSNAFGAALVAVEELQ